VQAGYYISRVALAASQPLARRVASLRNGSGANQLMGCCFSVDAAIMISPECMLPSRRTHGGWRLSQADQRTLIVSDNGWTILIRFHKHQGSMPQRSSVGNLPRFGQLGTNTFPLLGSSVLLVHTVTDLIRTV